MLVKMPRPCVRDTLSSSIVQGGCKPLDRTGESTARNFMVLTLDDTLQFFEWDLYHSTLFEVWGIVLRQSKRCVPKGGFLSA